jgi:serine/threonine protein kinase
LSKETQDFLMKCFAKDPSERPTADQLMQHPAVIKFVSQQTQVSNNMRTAVLWLQ